MRHACGRVCSREQLAPSQINGRREFTHLSLAPFPTGFQLTPSARTSACNIRRRPSFSFAKPISRAHLMVIYRAQYILNWPTSFSFSLRLANSHTLPRRRASHTFAHERPTRLRPVLLAARIMARECSFARANPIQPADSQAFSPATRPCVGPKLVAAAGLI